MNLTIFTGIAILLMLYISLSIFAFFFAEKLALPGNKSKQKINHPTLKLSLPNKIKIAVTHLENPEAKYTLIYSYGNTNNIENNIETIQKYYHQGLSVICYDYPGYGYSEGSPSCKNCVKAIFTVYDYLTKEKKVPPEKIIALGYSIGGGVTFSLAKEKPLAGILAEGNFKSIFDVALVKNILPWNLFNNVKKLPSIKCPVLFIHGMDDEVIPFSHGRFLYKKKRGRKEHLWIENANHKNYIDVAGEKYWKTLDQFIVNL